MLEYDNSAFYYFMIATCTVYLVPSTRFIMKKFAFIASSRKVDVGQPRTSLEKAKYKQLAEKQRATKAGIGRPFVLNLVVTICTWIMFFYLISLVWNDHEIASFDPFSILGIAPGISNSGIKKAYRKLSLKYHPDKNKGDAQAEQMFMKIAKAYEALTDEEAKKNYEKFGNPDGRQAMEVSIGLPTFLLEKENHQVILVIYLLVLVIAIPTAVCIWYNDSKQYMDNMIRHDTMGWYHHMLNEHTHIKVLPEVLAGSQEYMLKIKLKETQLEAVGKLERELKLYEETMQKEKYRNGAPEKTKGYYLLHAHLMGLKIGKSLREDQHFILEKAPHLIEGMLMYAASRRWTQTAKNIIEFHQRLVQAIWVKDSSLKQLPHFGESEVKHALRSKHKTKRVLEWVNASPEQRAGTKGFTDQMLKDVDDAVRCIPNIQAKFRIHVDDEPQICAGDLLTLELTMDRLNLKDADVADDDEDAVGDVYAPDWPFKRKEGWWVFGCLGDELLFFKKVSKNAKHVVENVQLPGPGRPGTYVFDVHLMCDSYIDCDVHSTVKIEVLNPNILPAYKAHPDDEALDDEPTLFDAVLESTARGSDDSNSDDDSSDSSSDSDWEDTSLLTDAEKKKRDKRRALKKAQAQKNAGGAAEAEGDDAGEDEQKEVADSSSSDDDE